MHIPSLSQPPRPAADPLWTAAAQLETSFLTEMLTAAGLGNQRASFGGGPGEEHFASFLVQEQARALVQAGGIGLTETLFAALAERRHEG